MLRPLHPRIAQLTAFVSGLGANDVVAPVLGTRRLADYLVRLPHDRSLTAHASDVASGG
jgi:hypothetical protein